MVIIFRFNRLLLIHLLLQMLKTFFFSSKYSDFYILTAYTDKVVIIHFCCFFADTPVCYQVEGSRQALRVTLYLDSCHFSELPSRLQNGGSLKLHTVLFTRGESGLET